MSVERYLGKLKPNTQVNTRYILKGFFDWLRVNGGQFRGLGPDDLVKWQRLNLGSYEVLDVVQEYVQKKEGRPGYKMRVYGAIRSFFNYNRCELPRDPLFAPRRYGTRAAVVGRLTVDEFRRVLASCNALHRAVFLCMFQGGLGVGELLFFNVYGFESLLRQLEDRVRPVKVDLPGRKKLKNVKPYYSFLGKDAVDALRVWLRERPVKCPEGHVFCTQWNKPLTYHSIFDYWRRHLVALGLIELEEKGGPGNRYGKNLHELRDLFRTRWRISGVDVEVAEFLMGHTIDHLGYDKSPWTYPDWYAEKYREAERWLNILSDEPEKMSRIEVQKEMDKIREEQDERIARLEDQMKLLEALKREKEKLRYE